MAKTGTKTASMHASAARTYVHTDHTLHTLARLLLAMIHFGHFTTKLLQSKGSNIPLCCSKGLQLGRRSRLVVDRFVSSCLSSSTLKRALSARHCFLNPPGCSEHVASLWVSNLASIKFRNWHVDPLRHLELAVLSTAQLGIHSPLVHIRRIMGPTMSTTNLA